MQIFGKTYFFLSFLGCSYEILHFFQRWHLQDILWANWKRQKSCVASHHMLLWDCNLPIIYIALTFELVKLLDPIGSQYNRAISDFLFLATCWEPDITRYYWLSFTSQGYQKYKSTRVQEYKSTRVQEYKSKRVHEYRKYWKYRKYRKYRKKEKI